MSRIKYILSAVIFCTVILGICSVLNYLLIDDSASYTRLMMHELYNSTDNIDVLFVGASHCYESFDTEITDRKFGQNTFNAGSSSQDLDSSYELIREVSERNKLKQVYLEIPFIMLTQEGDYADRTQMTGTYLISDYEKPSLHKVIYLLKASSEGEYVNSFFPARRNATSLFVPSIVGSTIRRKNSDIYKNYRYEYANDNSWGQYMGKGFVSVNPAIQNDSFYYQSRKPVNYDISEDRINSIRSIIRYCDSRKIKLTAVTAPMPSYVILQSGIDYDRYLDELRDILKGTDVKLVDFNLCKTAYFPDESEYFSDDSHLNKYGAKKFSDLFSDYFTGRLTDDIFYGSYKEKSRSLPIKLCGLSFNDTGNVRNIDIISNHPEQMEYRVVMLPKDSARYIVQDYSSNTSFDIDINEHGICKIYSRIKGKKDIKETDFEY